MSQPRPPEIDNDGDQSVQSPAHRSESLLASERGSDATRRLETDSSNNLFVNIGAGSVSANPILYNGKTVFTFVLATSNLEFAKERNIPSTMI